MVTTVNEDRGVGVDISCVIPTHGRPDLLAGALESVAAQTRRPDEVIVVSDDDGAEAAAVVRTAAAGGLEVRHLVRDGVPGASASRNHGAAAARGRVLAFLDDDDLWEPQYLAVAGELLDTSGAAAVGTRWVTFGDGEPVTSRAYDDVGFQDVFLHGTPALGSNLVIHRAAFEAIGGYDTDLRFQNDADLLARLLARGDRYRHVDEVLVRVRKHGRGQLSDHSPERADGMVAVYEKHRREMSPLTRKHFRLRIHRMRYDAATDPRTRARHLVGMALNFNRSRLTDLRWLARLPGADRVGRSRGR